MGLNWITNGLCGWHSHDIRHFKTGFFAIGRYFGEEIRANCFLQNQGKKCFRVKLLHYNLFINDLLFCAWLYLIKLQNQLVTSDGRQPIIRISNLFGIYQLLDFIRDPLDYNSYVPIFNNIHQSVEILLKISFFFYQFLESFKQLQ